MYQPFKMIDVKRFLKKILPIWKKLLKASENILENKVAVCMNGFQKFLCMVEGHYNDFLALVSFLSIFLDVIDQKMTGAKKDIFDEKSIYYAHQSREEIFEIRSC